MTAALEQKIFSDAWSLSGLAETFEQEHTLLIGAWEGEKLAGYVIFYYVLDEGEIARIAVDQTFRRKGVGRCLIGALEVACEEKGINRILLDVRKSNESAREFYRKTGFSEDGSRRGFYTNPSEDAILMSRDLGR